MLRLDITAALAKAITPSMGIPDQELGALRTSMKKHVEDWLKERRSGQHAWSMDPYNKGIIQRVKEATMTLKGRSIRTILWVGIGGSGLGPRVMQEVFETPETLELIEFIKSKIPKKPIRADSGISIKPISLFGTERIVRYAFVYARSHGRKKVTTVHKANIMKHTDGLFLSVAQRVAAEFSDIAHEDVIVDNMCMQLVQKPELYDVLVCPNLYGDIISDLASGLVGGLGVTPGANIGSEYAIFEAVHGSAPKYAGQNKVNPTAMILAGKIMLEHLGERDAATRLETAVARVIAENKSVTYDMKPHRDDPTAVGTAEMGNAVIAALT